MQKKVNLASYSNAWYKPGPRLKSVLWYVVNSLVLKNSVIPFSALRVKILRVFGAKIGLGVVIKPGVSIKYPWKLSVGNHCWIGEDVWIDNLDQVTIGDHVCISQGAMFLSGNHNYKSTTFDLMVAPIIIESGAWIGAKTVVCQGTIVKTHAVLTVASVATGLLGPYAIYKGNPAVKIKDRQII